MKNNTYFGGTNLGWGEYNFDSNRYAKIPPAPLNGGLYTGEPFKKNAPYANIPVVPDEGYMTNYNLRSANPPLEALYQYNNFRPGNNIFGTPGIEYVANHRMTCIPIDKIKAQQIVK